MIKNGLFLLSFFSGVTLVFLSILALAIPRFSFWPPPRRNSWQYWTFWPLYRILFAGVVVLSVLDFSGMGEGNTVLRYFAGLPLAIIGFSLVFYITCYLGWANAHGQKKGLRTDGLYLWSRNPMYVVSILGFVGLGITVNSVLVWTLLGFWSLFYLLAPFMEEPWLEQQYGEAFVSYRVCVPRFIGLQKAKRGEVITCESEERSSLARGP